METFLCLLAFIYSPFITKGISSFKTVRQEGAYVGKASFYASLLLVSLI